MLFKTENEHKKDIDVIGQFGVGFYSAFMVSKEVEVISKKYDEDKFHLWKSSGTSGYSIDDIDTDGDFSTKICSLFKR